MQTPLSLQNVQRGKRHMKRNPFRGKSAKPDVRLIVKGALQVFALY